MAVKLVAPGGGVFTTGTTWVGGVAPVAGDYITADETSGNLTLSANTLTTFVGFDFTGYTGTLNLTSFSLNSGTVGLTASFGASMSIISTTGLINFNPAISITCRIKTNGCRIPRIYLPAVSGSTKNFTDDAYIENLHFQDFATCTGTGSIYVYGTFSASNSLLQNTNKVVIYGTSTASVFDYAASSMFQNLEINTPGSVKLTSSGPLGIRVQGGTFNYISGSFTGTFVYKGGPNASFISSSSEVVIKGTPPLFGTVSISATGGRNIILNGDMSVLTLTDVPAMNAGFSQSSTATSSNVYVYERLNLVSTIINKPSSPIVLSGTSSSSVVTVSTNIGSTNLVIDTPGFVSYGTLPIYVKTDAGDSYFTYKSGTITGTNQPYLRIDGSANQAYIKSNSFTFSQVDIISGSSLQINLVDNLRCSGSIMLYPSTSSTTTTWFKGSGFETNSLIRKSYMNLATTTTMRASGSMITIFDSGSSYNVNGSLLLDGSFTNLTPINPLRSSTASSPAYINFYGVTQSIGNTSFTDITVVGTELHAFSEAGNTITRTTNILNTIPSGGGTSSGGGPSSTTFLM